MATVLVTGAAGLIGSAVVRNLIQEGIRVIACDNFSNGSWELDHEKILWKHIDVTDVSLADELKGIDTDAVIHCAAHPGGRSLVEPSEDVRVNCLGSMRIFEWCARSGVPVIYLSSSIVYGNQPPFPITENAALNPATIYAVCKVACENYLKILAEGYGLRWAALRLFSTYGEGHRPSEFQGIVNVMLTQLLAGNRVTVKGSLKRVRDIMYVDDAAQAIVKCLFEEKTRGLILNVGTGAAVTIEEIIFILCGLLGRRKEELEIVEASPTVGDPMYNVPDISRLKELTGFTPRYDSYNGLGRVVKSRMSGAS